MQTCQRKGNQTDMSTASQRKNIMQKYEMPTNKKSAKYWKWCGSQQNIQIDLQTSANVHDDGDDDGDHNRNIK